MMTDHLHKHTGSTESFPLLQRGIQGDAHTILQFTEPQFRALIDSIKQEVREQATATEIEAPINMAEAKAFLGIDADRTMLERIKRGEITGHRNGRLWYFFKSELIQDIKKTGRRPVP